MDNCIFCKIVNKELPTTVVYEDDDVLAINDTSPQAPIHVIIMPKIHAKDILEFNDKFSELSPALMNAISAVAKVTGSSENGFRIINNCGVNGGQTVPHLHLHFIAGKILGGNNCLDLALLCFILYNYRCA